MAADVRQILREVERLIATLESMPDEEIAKAAGSYINYLYNVDIRRVRAELPGYLKGYEAFRDGSVNGIAGIIPPSTDRHVKEAFGYFSSLAGMVESRFYRDGTYVGSQLSSKAEHERWYREFRGMLANTLTEAITAYRAVKGNLTALSKDFLVGGQVKKALAQYGLSLSDLPSVDSLVRAANKLVSVYDAYEKAEIGKYH